VAIAFVLLVLAGFVGKAPKTYSGGVTDVNQDFNDHQARIALILPDRALAENDTDTLAG